MMCGAATPHAIDKATGEIRQLSSDRIPSPDLDRLQRALGGNYDLGKLNYSISDPTLPAGVITGSSKVTGHIVRGGLNYRFNWTPWELVFGRR